MATLTAITRDAIKYLSTLLTALRPGRPDLVILMYHRVTGDSGLELDVRYEDFCQQMRWLAANTEVISLDEAIEVSADREKWGGANEPRQSVVITFDDAFEDFYSMAWPVLRDLKLPATLYVPTGFIESPDSPPVSLDTPAVEGLRPVTWSMLRELSESSLVTLAAHSHAHNEYPLLGDAQMESDVEQSMKAFQNQLGIIPRHFAYPRGAWNLRCEDIVSLKYETVALVGGGGQQWGKLNRKRLRRIPVLLSDGQRWFERRVMGRLFYEEQLASLIRRLRQKST